MSALSLFWAAPPLPPPPGMATRPPHETAARRVHYLCGIRFRLLPPNTLGSLHLLHLSPSATTTPFVKPSLTTHCVAPCSSLYLPFILSSSYFVLTRVLTRVLGKGTQFMRVSLLRAKGREGSTSFTAFLHSWFSGNMCLVNGNQ